MKLEELAEEYKCSVVILVVHVCIQASTQTDAMRVPVSRRRQMKNKSVLCRPFTMDQEILCQLSEAPTGSEGNCKDDTGTCLSISHQFCLIRTGNRAAAHQFQVN